jgi:dihydropteroate synthase
MNRPAPAPTRIGGRLFDWTSRTYVMGIVNVTPDSFSGDGLLAAAGFGAATQGAALKAAADAGVAQARRMVEEGADIIDVGGESTRPGHMPVAEDEEAARIVPVIAAIRSALPDVPVSVDTSKVSVAAAGVDAGASLLNDIWGVAPDDAMARLAADRGIPLVLMHNRAEPRYEDLMTELLDDLRGAVERAVRAGVPAENVIVDPGFGFGKTPAHNLTIVRDLGLLRELGRPILLGTSRKSTLGKVLGDVPPEERLEATLATTALGIANGANMVRVHDVRPNVRVARICDAVMRGALP